MTLKIEHALIDPRWSWGFVTIADEPLPCLTLHHPEHGDIHCLLSPEVVQQLGEWLRVGENPGIITKH